MDPILDIRSVRPGRFTYSLRAPGQPARPSDEFFDALADGLRDSARSLLHYFERVQVQVRGVPVGTFAVVRLLQEPVRIADEVQVRFVQVCGAWPVDTAPAPLAALIDQDLPTPAVAAEHPRVPS